MAEQTVNLAGMQVRRIGYGAMQLPGPGVFGPPRDHAQAIAVLRRAIELGVNHIDTSQYYGPDVANELIREALHPYPQDLAIVSKVGARRDERKRWLPWDSPDDLRAGVELNLRTLDSERLAAVNLRLMNEQERGGAAGYELDDQLASMHAMREEGLIGGVGISNVTARQLDQALAAGPVACVQNQFSLLKQEDRALLERCGAEGIPYVPFWPLGSSFAKVKVTDLQAVKDVAAELGATPAQVGLAWLLAQGEHVLLIPGTATPSHLEENVAAGELELSAEALHRLDSAVD